MVEGASRSSAWWDGTQWCQSDAAWRRDVALEMWIDTESAPIRIRLAGTLEGGTATSLVSVIQDLILEGGRDFELDTSALYAPDTSSSEVLADLAQLVSRSGGRLTWDGSTTVAHPDRGTLVGL
ncbi:MAG: hypothetical protein ACLPVF_13285 [Acidimicrobiales bacterium]